MHTRAIYIYTWDAFLVFLTGLEIIVNTYIISYINSYNLSGSTEAVLVLIKEKITQLYIIHLTTVQLKEYFIGVVYEIRHIRTLLESRLQTVLIVNGVIANIDH